MIEMEVTSCIGEVYTEIKSTPFYKADKGYQYAAYLLESTEKETMTSWFLNSSEEEWGGTKEIFRALKDLIQDVIRNLSSIIVSDEDLTGWMTFQKATGGIVEYHKLLEELWENIVALEFTAQIIPKTIPTSEEVERGRKDGKSYVYYGASWNQVVDKTDCRKTDSIVSSEMILNHNNPFSDISIKEQTFIYGSMMGQFESLVLNTSHNMTKIDKDTEKSYIALQPGFKIKKQKKGLKEKKLDITFDDTITTEVMQNDNNIYVYID